MDIIVEEAVVAELEATDRDGVLREMVRSLGRAKKITARHADEIVASLAEREKQGTTGIGKGVAVPHTKHDGVKEIVATVARSAKGVDFGSLDQQPVHLFFMVLSPAGKNQEYLKAMDRIFRHLNKDNFRKFLRQAPGRDEVLRLLREADAADAAETAGAGKA
jgi:PTS system fructose-specific IIA component/PTS system nitrogen regulatory IIA component